MKVQPIRTRDGEPTPKLVENFTQTNINALELGSGDYRIKEVPGLYIRCRETVKSYQLVRRIDGELVKETLGISGTEPGQLTAKDAKKKAQGSWSAMKPKPAGGLVTLEGAFGSYLAGMGADEESMREHPNQSELKPRTVENYRYNLDRYLAKWKKRSLLDIGNDRAGMRTLFERVAKKYGASTANQVARLISVVYRYQRQVDKDLPEPPTVAVKLKTIKARDWALTDDELRAWWTAVQKLDSPVKKVWWQVVLLTGARRESIESVPWSDVDFKTKRIHFATAKRDPYTLPMSEKLTEILQQYRASTDSDSKWVFPSPTKEGEHLRAVRDDKRGVISPSHFRHTLRTALANLGASPESKELMLGHKPKGVSGGYVTLPHVVESFRPWANAVADHYTKILTEKPAEQEPQK